VLQNATVPPMADIINFPKHSRYDVVEDLVASIHELCEGETVGVVMGALVTVLASTVAAEFDPKDRAKIVSETTRLIKDGVALCAEGDDEVTRSH
jgi:hypothetical protein